jgi:hypothetical protein
MEGKVYLCGNVGAFLSWDAGQSSFLCCCNIAFLADCGLFGRPNDEVVTCREYYADAETRRASISSAVDILVHHTLIVA